MIIAVTEVMTATERREEIVELCLKGREMESLCRGLMSLGADRGLDRDKRMWRQNDTWARNLSA